MAVRYNVTHYSFREPNAISEYEYLDLKKKLQTQPDFSLIDPNDTITNQFSRLFKFLTGPLISLPILIILILAEVENGFGVILMLITGIWVFVGFFMFMMSITDLSTYAGYLKKKRAYFTRMEKYIRKSKDYDDFFDNFYQ